MLIALHQKDGYKKTSPREDLTNTYFQCFGEDLGKILCCCKMNLSLCYTCVWLMLDWLTFRWEILLGYALERLVLSVIHEYRQQWTSTNWTYDKMIGYGTFGSDIHCICHLVQVSCGGHASFGKSRQWACPVLWWRSSSENPKQARVYIICDLN